MKNDYNVAPLLVGFSFARMFFPSPSGRGQGEGGALDDIPSSLPADRQANLLPKGEETLGIYE